MLNDPRKTWRAGCASWRRRQPLSWRLLSETGSKQRRWLTGVYALRAGWSLALLVAGQEASSPSRALGPPSTTMVAPFMKAEASEASKMEGYGILWTLPQRPRPTL